MRNPLVWIRWLVALIAVALAVLFVYQVFVIPNQQDAPRPTTSVSPSPAP